MLISADQITMSGSERCELESLVRTGAPKIASSNSGLRRRASGPRQSDGLHTTEDVQGTSGAVVVFSNLPAMPSQRGSANLSR